MVLSKTLVLTANLASLPKMNESVQVRVSNQEPAELVLRCLENTKLSLARTMMWELFIVVLFCWVTGSKSIFAINLAL